MWCVYILVWFCSLWTDCTYMYYGSVCCNLLEMALVSRVACIVYCYVRFTIWFQKLVLLQIYSRIWMERNKKCLSYLVALPQEKEEKKTLHLLHRKWVVYRCAISYIMFLWNIDKEKYNICLLLLLLFFCLLYRWFLFV